MFTMEGSSKEKTEEETIVLKSSEIIDVVASTPTPNKKEEIKTALLDDKNDQISGLKKNEIQKPKSSVFNKKLSDQMSSMVKEEEKSLDETPPVSKKSSGKLKKLASVLLIVVIFLSGGFYYFFGLNLNLAKQQANHLTKITKNHLIAFQDINVFNSIKNIVQKKSEPSKSFKATHILNDSSTKKASIFFPSLEEMKITKPFHFEKTTSLENIAKKVYNNKEMWPYLYFYNEGNIQNPNKVIPLQNVIHLPPKNYTQISLAKMYFFLYKNDEKSSVASNYLKKAKSLDSTLISKLEILYNRDNS